MIFVTAYDEYALKAFEVHAVDYLLKPFSQVRLEEALTQARKRLNRKEALPVAGLVATARPKGELQRIVVKDGSRVHIIPVDKIDFIEAQDDYVSLHSEGRHYLKQQTIADLDTALDPARFIRIHRSYILNLDRLAKIELIAKESRVAILSNGKQLPVSRSGYGRLKALI